MAIFYLGGWAKPTHVDLDNIVDIEPFDPTNPVHQGLPGAHRKVGKRGVIHLRSGDKVIVTRKLWANEWKMCENRLVRLEAAKARQREEEEKRRHYCTTQEAVDISGYNIYHVRLLLNQGKIHGRKEGRIWLIERESLQEYLASKPRPGRKPGAKAATAT